ncbi:MAG: HPr family phosphocarrier protein [Longicatena sp.]
MKILTYMVKNKTGIHARPASSLFALARNYKCNIFLVKEGNRGKLSRIVDIMELNIKKGDTISFEIEGTDEKEAYIAIEQFCKDYL